MPDLRRAFVDAACLVPVRNEAWKSHCLLKDKTETIQSPNRHKKGAKCAGIFSNTWKEPWSRQNLLNLFCTELSQQFLHSKPGYDLLRGSAMALLCQPGGSCSRWSDSAGTRRQQKWLKSEGLGWRGTESSGDFQSTTNITSILQVNLALSYLSPHETSLNKNVGRHVQKSEGTGNWDDWGKDENEDLGKRQECEGGGFFSGNVNWSTREMTFCY